MAELVRQHADLPLGTADALVIAVAARRLTPTSAARSMWTTRRPCPRPLRFALTLGSFVSNFVEALLPAPSSNKRK